MTSSKILLFGIGGEDICFADAPAAHALSKLLRVGFVFELGLRPDEFNLRNQTKNPPDSGFLVWYRGRGSNSRPQAYESCALTI
jgi:hypothetical protein